MIQVSQARTESARKIADAPAYTLLCSLGTMHWLPTCDMEAYEHFHLIGRALWRWFVTRCYDALIIGLLWFAGLWYLHVPEAVLWGILGGLLHFIPHFGIALALVGPAIAAGVSGGWMRFLYVLILYSGIVIVDGFLIQPWLMKGVARVPFWISLLAPIVFGLLFSFWGVLLAAPLLAVFYAYRAYLHRQNRVGSSRTLNRK